MRFISTKFHAVEDYATALMLPILPRSLGWSDQVTNLMDGAACMVAGQSMLTNYEGGLIRVMPMKAHLAADGLLGATLVAAAAVMDEEPTEVRATLVGLGLFSIANALFTKTRPGSAVAASRESVRRFERPMDLERLRTGSRGEENGVAPGTESPAALNRLNSQAPGLGTLADQANKGNLT
ncbi:MAG TPA: hypothetical protein VEA69_21330 [Tepidisphaeraceae bacterium]|nr:hypothetical protein [Tepidisphaeraceae bacterium]